MEDTIMSLEHTIRAVAGTFVLGSLALGWFVSSYWFLLTAFVGANLLQSSITKWCLMEDILKKTIFAERYSSKSNPDTARG
jgi:hypothetical protein